MAHDRNEDAAAAHDHGRTVDMQARIVDAVGEPFGGQRAEDVLCCGPRQHEPVDYLGIVGVEADLHRCDRGDGARNAHELRCRCAPSDDGVLTVDVVEVQASYRDGRTQLFGTRRVHRQESLSPTHRSHVDRQGVRRAGAVSGHSVGELGRAAADVEHERGRPGLGAQASGRAGEGVVRLAVPVEQLDIGAERVARTLKELGTIGGVTRRARGNRPDGAHLVILDDLAVFPQHVDDAADRVVSQRTACVDTAPQPGDPQHAQTESLPVVDEQPGGVGAAVHHRHRPGLRCSGHEPHPCKPNSSRTQSPTGSSPPASR